MTKIISLKAIIITALIILIGCGGGAQKDSTEAVDTVAVAEAVTEEIIEKTLGVEDTTVFLLDSIRRGEGPFNVMERLRVDRNIRQRILFALANEADLTTLRVGEKFAAIYNLDTTLILEFIYFQDRITTHRIKIERGNDTTEITHVLDERPHKTRHRLIRGTLNSPTLETELRNMELSPRAAQIAVNVLECKIAFRTDARIGDRFEILLAETVFQDTVDGVAVEAALPSRTDILFVSYAGERVRELRAYKFFDAEKSSHNAHYTEAGEALIFAGLRYPLDRIHITSSYGYRRHPVTGKNAMHWGVDYRASVGTPVYAVAEGVVIKSTFDNASGNYIAIRHNDNTSSYYLHLSRRNVNTGARVKARQVIGLTGNTGLSAGPHLHFGFRQANGAWMNPLSKRMIATPKLEGEMLERLIGQIEEIRVIYRELGG
ncbi:MAG: M23 family metallopeptidase [Chitinispirillales bacterium]|nr:M23 family metallopeptidase [Chitinispirillales bacterium]